MVAVVAVRAAVAAEEGGLQEAGSREANEANEAVQVAVETKGLASPAGLAAGAAMATQGRRRCAGY